MENSRTYAPEKGIVPDQDWGPFKKIPNVRNFRVQLGLKNKLLAAFGIETKFHPTFSYEPYFNYGMNKYFNYQIYRLRAAAKNNPKLYFKIVNELLRHSKVLFVIGLSHVEPRWHRELPLWYVMKLWKAHNKISQLKHWDAHHHRLYIDKANGKKRPLGVPEMVWRIYLHQVANFLSLYLEERKFFSESQHGFRTRLGTKTAWQKILEKVVKADWIYEFDLERCFPNIHIKGVSRSLRKAKIPEGWIRKFEHLNMTPVTNPASLRGDTVELNEVNKWIKAMEKIEATQSLKRWLPSEGPVSLQNVLYWNLEEERQREAQVTQSWEGDIETWDLHRFTRDSGIPIEELYEGTESDPKRGLPQGLPTSPLLTIASLETNFIRKSKWDLIMYADDGLVYGRGKPPSEEELITNLSSDRDGITINREKSGFAKLPGGEIDLKFLGMRLKGDVLSAETRNGARLEYDKNNLIEIYDMLDNWGIIYKPEVPVLECPREEADSEEQLRDKSHFHMYQAWTNYWKRSRWEKLASSKLFGMIQARLFQDGWNIPITQCFELTHKRGSWVDLRKDSKRLRNDELSVFNSTSLAAHDLLNTLSKLKNKGRGQGAQGK